MNHEPRITIEPSGSVYRSVIRSTTGEQYPGTPDLMYIPEYLKRYEYLRDEKGPRSFNPCMHYVKQCNKDRPYSTTDGWYTTGNPANGYWRSNPVPIHMFWDCYIYGDPSLVGAAPVFGPWEKPIKGLPPIYVDDGLVREVVPIDAIVLKSLIDRSLDQMLPGIKPKLSLLNTVFELKDVSSLGRSLDRIHEAMDALNRLKGVVKLSTQALKLLSGKSKSQLVRASLRSILKSGADSYLQAQFNIAPLLKDIAAFQAAYRSVVSQVNRLVDNAGRTQIAHFRAGLRNEYVPKTENLVVTLPSYMVQPTIGYSRSVTYPTAEFCATLEYSYKLPYYLSPEDYLSRGVLDALGVTLNPQIIWNAIPWSFVADWTLGISKWLGQFQMRNIEPVTFIGRYGFSLHVERHVQVSVGEGGNVVPFARFWEEGYYRTPHQPDLYRSITSTGLNLKEFSLSGALALSRR